ncbi:MAG: NAD(P)H-dependent flavin oxidoreductase [Oligoflexales bacterium]
MTAERLCNDLKIAHPIIQGGMVWVSGAKLAAAVANAGCLGVIGAGSMRPELLKTHIQKAQNLLNKNCPGRLAVNIPLLYKYTEEHINIILSSDIRVIITSAGSPKIWTQKLQKNGCYVLHVTSSPRLAKKCEAAGVNAIIAEGFEAGGHNGREETSTMPLIPSVVDTVRIPVIAAGGIYNGRGIAASLALGASGVQLGSRFAATKESSAHDNFKNAILESQWGDTQLCLKSIVPVRLLKNPFSEKVITLENNGGTKESLQNLLSHGRARKGMLEGDLIEGELEIGQVSGGIHDIPTVHNLVQNLLQEYRESYQRIPQHL